MHKVTLYRKHKNSMGYWSIETPAPGLIVMRHATTMGGCAVIHEEEVDRGRQGRSIEEQTLSRINSRISRMLDKGYKRTIEEAQTSSDVGQHGFYLPMLAHPISKITNPNFDGAVQQKKLNGHRCLTTMQDGEVIPYSRKGKPIPAIKHIIEGLKSRLPEGVTIDGELYVHGQRLQTIASWVKAEQASTAYVNYVLYDIISDQPYKERHAELTDIVKGLKLESPGQIMVLPYEEFESIEHCVRRRDEVISKGFEGMMIRLDKRGYEINRRSDSLIKVKKFLDDEFVVVDVVLSDKGRPVCVCKTKGGKLFRVNPPGDVSEKMEVFTNKANYIGKLLTVEYAELTEDGIPFHATSTNPSTSWRVDI